MSLPRATLAANTASESLDALGFAGLAKTCAAAAAGHEPEPERSADPRFDLPIVYSRTRALRMEEPGCVVCDDKTCPAVDIVPLPTGAHGEDLVWLTPNLYPIVFPFGDGAGVQGVHMVQWSSLHHDGGLCGADRDTAVAIVEQLTRAEEFLLHQAPAAYPETGDGHRGHVAIIKNRGRRVGGSVEHDHQQILLTDVEPDEPRRVAGLGGALLRGTPRSLIVDAVDGLAYTLVAPFMRRPLHAFIVPAGLAEGPEPGHLHHMDEPARAALAVAVARLSHAISTLMAERGEPAWNLVVHSGPGRGPLVELRPYTQPLGGYEQLGLYMCEETPADSAARLRDALPG